MATYWKFEVNGVTLLYYLGRMPILYTPQD